MARPIFCRRIIINKPELVHEKGPLLIACNHPNSFLDHVMLDILFDQPLYSLARGDVFKKPFYARLLTSLRILPVYRLSEGASHLNTNYATFEACRRLFQDKGIVIIASEGKCINEWHLRPLKKGTARLALSSWEAGIPLRVLPVGINYSSFRRFGKNLFINFGEMIEEKDIDMRLGDGLRHQAFNTILEQQLKNAVYEIPKNDKERQSRLLERKPSAIKKWLLSIPAFIGFITHWPVYKPLRNFTYKRTNHNDHYDAVLTGLLLITYPFYLLLITLAVFFFIKSSFVFLLLLLLPFTAWAYVQLKPQLDK